MQYREIIRLGRHKLMCGDATNREDIFRLLDGERVDLVLTDPPYGIKIQHGKGTIGSHKNELYEIRKGDPRKFTCKEYPPIIGDDSTDTAREHYGIIKELCKKLIIWGGQYFTDFLPVSGGWLFWDKNRRGLDFSDGELAWRSWGQKISYYKQTWNGVCMEGNYSLNGRYMNGRASRLHPTQKPVELHAKILEDFTQPDEVILDCFGGSGTTLIAAEITGRKCLMMEISPEYCEIIRERYCKLKEDYPIFSETWPSDSTAQQATQSL